MLLYIWIVVIVVAISLYFKQKSDRYETCGVKTLPAVQTIKNMFRLFTGREHFIEEIDRCYKTFPNERFVGRFDFTANIVMVNDIELIKHITVKDFEHFLDHRSLINEENDPLFGRNILSMKGQEWKDMRSTLSPAFTSSKIRHMVPFMVDVGKQMIESLKTKLRESNDNYIEIDIKDVTGRFANDVVATCAFGLNVDSQSDPNNLFYQMGKRAVNFDGSALKLFLLLLMPRVMKKLNITVFSDDLKSFFTNMVLDTMKDREAKNIIRPDMIHLLMEAKKGQLVHEEKSSDADAGFATVEESAVGKKNTNREWSDNDLIAQAVIFFLAGFETVSSAMCFTLHELAVNPDIQDKLAQEIRETDARNGEKFDYNSIQNMKYMDMVVSEALRLWPPGSALDRLCVKDYNLGKANPNAKDFTIRAGDGIVFPVFSIHRDPKYFADPLKFDPERFSDENKHKILPFTYLPFGSGPRNCIGSRFALCEVKVMLYQLLQQFEVSPGEKTCIPARINPKSFNFSLLGGHWVRLKIRS